MTDSQRLPSVARTPYSDATDDLDAVITNLRIVLDRPGDPLPLNRAMLERLSRHAGRALLYLTENGPPQHHQFSCRQGIMSCADARCAEVYPR